MNADELYISHIIIVILISIGLGCYCKSNFFSNITQQDIESLEHDIESLENRLNRQQISQRELLQQQRDIQNFEPLKVQKLQNHGCQIGSILHKF